jgi:ectoine hydroxylase-related dioxygenase (phytanoyl-CoA dioxygenase family)
MKLAPDQEALLPTEEEVRFYREHGYYVSRRIFSDEEIDAAVEGADRFYAGEIEPSGIEAVDDFMAKYGPTGSYGNRLRKHDYASYCCGPLARVVRSPVVGAIAARLAGTPQVRLWHDQLLYKPPQDPSVSTNVGWHTDRGYWLLCTSANMLTAWIPFHDSDSEIGTITMIDGSHLWPDNTGGLDFFDGDLDTLEKRFQTGGKEIVKVPMILKKGQVSFHHCLTIHGSGPNRTDRPRRSVAVHLQDAANRYREFRMPNGETCWHYNVEVAPERGGVPDFTDRRAFPVLYENPAG